MQIIKTPTGMIKVDETTKKLTQIEYDALGANKKDGIYLITDSSKKNIIGLYKDGIQINNFPASKIALTPSGNITKSNVQEAIIENDSHITTTKNNLSSHMNNTSNPHKVTKTQVGLGNVDNTSDANKPVSTAQKKAIDAVNTSLTTHTGNTTVHITAAERTAWNSKAAGNHAHSWSEIGSKPSSFNPSAGSLNYVRVYNSNDVGQSYTVTFNDLAKQHSAVAMIDSATDNPIGKQSWCHCISMAWANNSNSNWVSQIALGTEAGTGMWYRTTAGAITGRGWNRVLDSANYTLYCTPANIGAASSNHTHSQYYDSGVSRTANTVLAAPNGSNGSASFRKLVAADIPSLTRSKISDLGNAASKTIRTASNVTASGWVDVATDQKYVPDMAFIAYWNGAYSGGNSNLAYCNMGAFGTAATKNISDFAASNHTHSYITGGYTGNGGQQQPNYFGTGKVGCLMMNTTINNNTNYKNFLIMDPYSGNDVGGATAIAVDRQEIRAYIMGSEAARTSWTRSAELLTTANYTSYAAKASHTHNYAGSSSAGGAATNADKVDGFHASQTAGSKSTCVVTDANGYTNLNYINSNTGNNENPTVSQVIVTNGSDNYYRKASLSHIKSALGSMPASDVYSWAKASTKPSYSWSEIGSKPSSFNPSAGSLNYVRVYNSSDVGSSGTVTFNDLAKQHSAVAMINPATDNPVGKQSWCHCISMAWTNNSNSNWVSQIALGTEAGTGMWYRTTSGAITGRGWNRVLDSSNYKDFINNANEAYYGSDEANSNGWYKIGTYTLTGFNDHSARLLITEGFGGGYYATIRLRVRCNNSSLLDITTLKYEIRYGFTDSSVLITADGNKWSLYVYRMQQQYGRLKVKVLDSCGTAGNWIMKISDNNTKESEKPNSANMLYATDGSIVESSNSVKLNTMANNNSYRLIGTNTTVTGDSYGNTYLTGLSFRSGSSGNNTLGGFDILRGSSCTMTGGPYGAAIGYKTKATGGAFACGNGTAANGNYSHAEGDATIASGSAAHAEGYHTTASGYCSHAEGYETTASGIASHAEGLGPNASGNYSHAEGGSTTASGSYSHAEGFGTTASGESSHAEGEYTTASNYASHAGGHYNAIMYTGGNSNNTNGTAFVIGNGTGSWALSNAFSVQFNGVVKAKSSITGSTTADYAEFFEWEDGNPDNEDRVGKFVTINNDKILIATDPEDYILGIVSGEPFVLGNGDCDTWNGMYLRDEFNRTIYEPAPKMELDEETGEEKEVLDENGNPVYQGTRPKLNPDYDPSKPYISRFDRKEWAPIGMLGVLSVIHDGTCKVNGYAKCNKDGIATACKRTDPGAYRVIAKMSDTVVRVIFR